MKYLRNLSLFLMTVVLLGCGDSTTTVKEKKEATENVDPLITPGSTKGVPYTKQNDAAARREPSANEMEEDIQTDVDATIESIRTRYQEIVEGINKGAITSKKQEVSCQERDGYGELIRYIGGEEVVMLEYSEGVGHSSTLKKIYFQDGDPFFVYIEFSSWSPGGPFNEDGTPGHTTNTEEYRYYLADGEVVRKLEKDFQYRSWTDDPTSSEVTNQTVENRKGEHFPSEEQLEKWKAGDVSC